jgi:hypothetical protein
MHANVDRFHSLHHNLRTMEKTQVQRGTLEPRDSDESKSRKEVDPLSNKLAEMLPETDKGSRENTDANEEEEEEYDRYKDNPDLLNEAKIAGAGGSRLFSYDW